MLDLNYLAIKSETVPGTFINPTYAADAVLCYDYQPTPIKQTGLRRSIDRPFAGRKPSLPTAVHAGHTFKTELCGSGTALTAASWGKLLTGCLFGTSTVEASDVLYPLSSTGDGGSLSLLGNKDLVRHRATMMRGTATLNYAQGQMPYIDWSFLGLIQGGVPADSAAAAGLVLPVYPAPLEVNNVNTTLSVGGYTLGMVSLKLDFGMKTALYQTTGAKQIIFDKAQDGDRRSMGGTLVAEMPDPATQSYFANVLAGTALAFSLVHGTVAGNIVGLSSASFVPTDITYSQQNNRLMMNMPFDLVPVNGNDELTFITK